jgi:DNA-binding transcriptional regulator YiaG
VKPCRPTKQATAAISAVASELGVIDTTEAMKRLGMKRTAIQMALSHGRLRRYAPGWIYADSVEEYARFRALTHSERINLAIIRKSTPGTMRTDEVRATLGTTGPWKTVRTDTNGRHLAADVLITKQKRQFSVDRLPRPSPYIARVCGAIRASLSGSSCDKSVFSGSKLCAMRKNVHMTQSELAQLIGCPKLDMVREWERGLRTPGATYLLRIMEVLHAQPHDLLDDN